MAATLVALLLSLLGVLPRGPFGWPGALLAGASLNLAAQAGGLFGSWVKRRAGVKDSSGCFGPSGGLLDQLDSFLFTIPMAGLVGGLMEVVTRLPGGELIVFVLAVLISLTAFTARRRETRRLLPAEALESAPI